MESLKIWAGFSKRLDNYFMYMRHEGLYSSTVNYAKLPKCRICSKHVEIIKVEENEIWKNIINKIIQTTHIKSNQEFSIFHNNKYIYRLYKENNENNNFKIFSEIDDNKTIKEFIDSREIIIHKLYEIILADDIDNASKMKLKRPQDFEEDE